MMRTFKDILSLGPAGKLLNRALGDAGIARVDVYVTNAVKHFKFEERGKHFLGSCNLKVAIRKKRALIRKSGAFPAHERGARVTNRVVFDSAIDVVDTELVLNE